MDVYWLASVGVVLVGCSITLPDAVGEHFVGVFWILVLSFYVGWLFA